MSVFHNNALIGAGGGAVAAAADVATKSLRFSSGDSSFLNRTPSSAGNRKTFTWAAWIKKAGLGNYQKFFFGGTTSDEHGFRFENTDQLSVYRYSGSFTFQVKTTRVFRDPAAFFHLCVAYDSSQSTAADRVKIYINGIEETDFATSNYPSQNSEYGINNTVDHSIGRLSGAPSSEHFDGYLADVYFIDGSAISPVNNFIELDDNGVYQARAYSGTFGTNGFHLKFDDASSNAALGTDSSGNDNTFTVNNLVAAASSGTNYTNISTLAALSGSTLDSSYNDVSKVFDGSGTGVRTVSEVSNQGEKLSITFSPAITLSNETVSIDTSSTYQGMFVTVDGSDGSRVSGSDSAVTTLTTGSLSGSLSKITADNGTDTSGRPASILRIRIGGTELRDPVAATEVDSLFDAPTNGSQSDTGAGGEVSGNYCVFNPLSSGATLSNGNLEAEGPSNSWHIGRGTIAFPSSNKYYWEAEITGSGSASFAMSVATGDAANSVSDVTSASDIYGIVNNTGTTTTKFVNGTSSSISTAASWSAGDILMCAYDGATQKVWFGRNGTWYSSGDPGAGSNETMTASGTVFPAVHCYGTSGDMAVNFGARTFAYAAPTNFKPLCTALLPTATVADGSAYFDIDLYSGTGASHTRSGFSFGPDWVWIKVRDAGSSHRVFDTVRGAGKHLLTDDSGVEQTHTAALSAFTSDGYTLGANDDGATNVNQSGKSYVGWLWDGGTSTASNTDGSQTTSVRANATAGFSIVEGANMTSSQKTFGHGLNAAPEMIIGKRIGASEDWNVYHKDLTSNKMLTLNTTGAEQNSNFSGTPTSSVFTYYPNADSYIFYCFAPVAGYSAFGSFEGTGSADNFVYTGFRSRLVWIKEVDNANPWYIYDTARNTYNTIDNILQANASSSESTVGAGDGSSQNGLQIFSNGFSIPHTLSGTNRSGSTYIFCAWAENPLQANGGLAR